MPSSPRSKIPAAPGINYNVRIRTGLAVQLAIVSQDSDSDTDTDTESGVDEGASAGPGFMELEVPIVGLETNAAAPSACQTAGS